MTDDTNNDDSLAVFRTVSSSVEANLIQGVLNDHGIESALRADDLGGNYPNLTLVRGVKILVRRGDLERAESAMSQVEPLAENEAVWAPEEPPAD